VLTKEQIQDLSDRLNKAIPSDVNDDGCFGTDGSFQALFHLYEKAFSKVSSIADEAIFHLMEISKHGPSEGKNEKKLNLVPTGDIEEFADKYDLKMVIDERKLPVGHPKRFTAEFDHVEVKDGPILSSEYGNGKTPDDAIKDYAKKISMKKIVVNAMGKNRREIDVWRLTDGSKEETTT
jgi:hypothetical protein